MGWNGFMEPSGVNSAPVYPSREPGAIRGGPMWSNHKRVSSNAKPRRRNESRPIPEFFHKILRNTRKSKGILKSSFRVNSRQEDFARLRGFADRNPGACPIFEKHSP